MQTGGRICAEHCRINHLKLECKAAWCLFKKKKKNLCHLPFTSDEKWLFALAATSQMGGDTNNSKWLIAQIAATCFRCSAAEWFANFALSFVPQVTLRSALHVTMKWKQTPCWSTCVPASSVSVSQQSWRQSNTRGATIPLWPAPQRSAPLNWAPCFNFMFQLQTLTQSVNFTKLLSISAKVELKPRHWFRLLLRCRSVWLGRGWSSVTNEWGSLKSLYGCCSA